MWDFYRNLWAKGDHLMETSGKLTICEPLPRVDAHLPLGPWTGGGIPSKKATIINIRFCLLLLDLLHLQKLMWGLK